MAFLAAGIFAVGRWGPSAWHHAQLLWSQRRCMSYVAPNGQLIYFSDPDDGTAILPSPPNCWLAVESGLPPPASLPPIRHYRSTGLRPVFGPAPAPVFLHRRSRGGGTERLVVVQCGDQRVLRTPTCVLCCRVIKPATLFHSPVLLWERSAPVAVDRRVVVGIPWTPAVSVFAGRADDSDPAHFTIDVDVDGLREVFDGRLQGDDTVKLQLRNGSGKNP